MFKYRAFSDPYFPTYALNTERYSVSLHIQSECRKIRARKNSVFGHFSRSACLCSSNTEILNIPYQSIYLTDGFTLAFHTFMTNGNKRSCTLTQSSSWKMQVCLSLYSVLVPFVMKGLIRFMFMATFLPCKKLTHYWLTLLTHLLSVFITWHVK